MIIRARLADKHFAADLGLVRSLEHVWNSLAVKGFSLAAKGLSLAGHETGEGVAEDKSRPHWCPGVDDSVFVRLQLGRVPHGAAPREQAVFLHTRLEQLRSIAVSSSARAFALAWPGCAVDTPDMPCLPRLACGAGESRGCARPGRPL